MDEVQASYLGRLETLRRSVLGRADWQESLFGQALDKQARPAAIAMADFNVDELAIEVGRFVGAIQPELDFGVPVQKGLESWQNPLVRKRRRGPDRQPSYGTKSPDLVGGI